MFNINGIQQLGVGVEDVYEAFDYYRKIFGMDIQVFDEAAKAELMLAHTDGTICERHAILALNMQGGGGFEIWQHKGKKPEKIAFDSELGDLGINIGKLKCTDAKSALAFYRQNGVEILTELQNNPAGTKHFYLKDQYENIWEVIEDPFVFQETKAVNGGVFGVTIGVKDIDESLKIYKDLLGYSTTVYDKTGMFEDLKDLPGGAHSFRRILLYRQKSESGAFSPLFGPSTIELVQRKDYEARNIFINRIWGDPGFIHLCFDINDLDDLREKTASKGFPFTVDSAKAMDSFDMGEAAGNFAYIQAPDLSLIEFVETHKVPLLKKFGWYLNLRKRGNKPLPNRILKLFALKRVK